METLSHIIASFDISQVILSAFPQILLPLVHAFQGMFTMLSDTAMKLFSAHPGIFSGTIIFLLVYGTWSALLKLRHTIVSIRNASPGRKY